MKNKLNLRRSSQIAIAFKQTESEIVPSIKDYLEDLFWDET